MNIEEAVEAKAFVLFSAGPVQRFIASARTVRDLWTGSFLMAWLTRHAMQPILDHCGPEAFVLPDMSRDPLPLDGNGGGDSANDPGGDSERFPASTGSGSDEARRARLSVRVACLPNRFLAEVPEVLAETLAQQCRQAFRKEWENIADRVKEILETAVPPAFPPTVNDNEKLLKGWQESVARLWQHQVESFFDDQDVRVVVLRWRDFSPELVQELLGPAADSTGSLSPERSEASQEDRLWTDRMQMVFRLLAAQKAIRKVTQYRPAANPLGMYAPKCTLLGTYEQLGPAELSRSAPFWRQFADKVTVRGVRLRRGERLCAPSLVKRFAWSAYLQETLSQLASHYGQDPPELRFEDMATVAAAEWLKIPPELDPSDIRRRHHDWNGQWLHWNRPDQNQEDRCPPEIWREIWPIIRQKREKQGGAPSYYAILMIDGDRMGQRLNECAGPDHPRSLSKTLANFALEWAVRIVEEHQGTLIYCGGDDLLALLPTSQVLGCAQKVREKFLQNWKAAGLKCSQATVSGGIVIVHYKEDLRFALEQVRQAEKQAKNAGRNILGIRLCRRSGEHQTALCPWDFVQTVQEWVNAFLPKDSPEGKLPGASDRWAYHLYQELPVLEGLTDKAIEAELRRQMDHRVEETTRKRLFGAKFKQSGEELVKQFRCYFEAMKDRFSEADSEKPGKILRHFLTLCQMASFLARRREE